MTALVPSEFLFRCTFGIPKVDRLPRRGKRLLNLPSACRLPSLAEMSGRAAFGELSMAWNDSGLAVCVSVRGRSDLPMCDPEKPFESDGLRLWIDTRNTQSVHRATRFCQQFELLPAGGGEDGAAPVIVPRPIPRAADEPPPIDVDLIPIWSEILSTGYDLEVWFTADVLHGFDPARQPKLGFFYALNDRELGLQTSSVGPEFPFAGDPSLWSTIELLEGDTAG
jgi:hypothetical protein